MNSGGGQNNMFSEVYSKLNEITGLQSKIDNYKINETDGVNQ